MPHPTGSRSNDPRQPHQHHVDPFWTTCPLGSTWRTWDFMNVPARRLTGDALERHLELRRMKRVRDLGELRLDWEIAADDPGRLLRESGGDRAGHHVWSSHVHTETIIDGAKIHIDWVTVDGSGPGRSLTEVRIFVGGILAGQAFTGGCSLGFGGGDFPAVALVGVDRALVVDGDRAPVAASGDGPTRRLRADAEVQRPCVRISRIVRSRQ